MDNRFLNNFLKSRQALANDMQSASKPKKDTPAPKGMSMATIIEDKPPKSKVLEYFRKRIEEIEDSEDD